MITLALALTAADFDALDRSVAQCARDTVNPVFAAEAEQRSQFTTDVYREQEAIVAERLDISSRKRALREGAPVVKPGDTAAKLELQWQAIEDRQRALNDRRMLQGLRNEAMDAKRRYYLAHCSRGEK